MVIPYSGYNFTIGVAADTMFSIISGYIHGQKRISQFATKSGHVKINELHSAHYVISESGDRVYTKYNISCQHPKPYGESVPFAWYVPYDSVHINEYAATGTLVAAPDTQGHIRVWDTRTNNSPALYDVGLDCASRSAFRSCHVLVTCVDNGADLIDTIILDLRNGNTYELETQSHAMGDFAYLHAFCAGRKK